MPYQHLDRNAQVIPLPVGKAVCIGRNYADHARELNNPVPSTPLLFIKPNTALVSLTEPLALATRRGPCHFETELAILIGSPLTDASEDQARQAIAGVGLALDLTLRELQDQLKSSGHPWELAKAFDRSCPLSPFIAPENIDDLQSTEFTLTLNGQLRQHGRTADMITPIYRLLSYCSQHFTLLPGDVVLTGTPAGVGILQSGDRLELQLADTLHIETEVIGEPV